jgi:hypothetical protein
VTTNKKKERGTVRVRWDWAAGWSFPRDGWLLPRSLKADWEAPDGRIQAHVDIDVAEGKARARHVEVESEHPHGIGWRTLGQIPVRDIVASAVGYTLRKAAPWVDGALQLPALTDAGPLLPIAPGREDADVVREIVQAAVGYRPDAEGLEVVRDAAQA